MNTISSLLVSPTNEARAMWRNGLFAVVLLGFPAGTSLACTASRALDGIVTIDQCDDSAVGGACIPGSRAVYDALQTLDIPGVFTIGIQTSPWRMYDAEGRIVTVEEIAAGVRAGRTTKHQRVRLIGSWTAAVPGGDGPTLAERLSDALEGFPVDGSDGFLWLSPKGEMRTTHQAFSAWRAGPYSVNPGDDVMVAFVPGALSQFEQRFADEGNGVGVVMAGVGHDVFMLCPAGALAAFERAADMGNAIGAYNAGLMHAEAGDRVAAIKWLEKASALGENKAAARIEAVTEADP